MAVYELAVLPPVAFVLCALGSQSKVSVSRMAMPLSPNSQIKRSRQADIASTKTVTLLFSYFGVRVSRPEVLFMLSGTATHACRNSLPKLGVYLNRRRLFSGRLMCSLSRALASTLAV
jgi:hypothetical protein